MVPEDIVETDRLKKQLTEQRLLIQMVRFRNLPAMSCVNEPLGFKPSCYNFLGAEFRNLLTEAEWI